MEVITRRQAAERGMGRYYTGKPCKNGHLAERYVTSNACVECAKSFAQETYREIKEIRDRARAAEGVAA